MPRPPRSKTERGVFASWLYNVTSFVSLLIFIAIVTIVNLHQNGMPAWAQIPVLAALVGQCALLLPLRGGLHSGLRAEPDGGPGAAPDAGARRRTLLLRASAVATLIASAIPFALSFAGYPGARLSPLPLAASLALLACVLSRPWALASVAALMLLAALNLALPLEHALLPIMMILGLLATFYASSWAWTVVRRLDAARRTEADLARARERLRFASELHDVQGHTLQVLALKTELAQRLLDQDVDAARAQLADARSLAADALAQTREIARGYRHASLDEELENAVDVLEAAGTSCELVLAGAPREAADREPLGRFVREATTNLLRHAPQASRARLELRREGPHWRIRMWNDGVAGEEPGSGSGLAGLERAFRERGGEVVAGREEGGFALTGVLPARVGAGSPAERADRRSTAAADGAGR